jgi:hypothetical protein
VNLLFSHRCIRRQTLALPHNPFEPLHWQGDGEHRHPSFAPCSRPTCSPGSSSALSVDRIGVEHELAGAGAALLPAVPARMILQSRPGSRVPPACPDQRSTMAHLLSARRCAAQQSGSSCSNCISKISKSKQQTIDRNRAHIQDARRGRHYLGSFSQMACRALPAL